MLPLLGAAAVLGLSGGLSPGPLLALVVSETLARGRRAGFAVAAAPLLTDGPIIVATWLLFERLARDPRALGVVSLAGAAFVAWLGLDGLRFTGASPGTASPGSTVLASLARGIGVNLLNPHPYLFWLTVGTPMLRRAAASGWWTAALMLLLFYLGLVGSKVALAVIVGRSRSVLRGAVYVWVNRGLGGLLLVLAALLAWDGATRLGWL